MPETSAALSGLPPEPSLPTGTVQPARPHRRRGRGQEDLDGKSAARLRLALPTRFLPGHWHLGPPLSLTVGAPVDIG